MNTGKLLMCTTVCLFFANMKGQTSFGDDTPKKSIQFLLPDGKILKNLDSLENAWGKGQVLFRHNEEDDKNGVMHLVKKSSDYTDKESKSKKALAEMLNNPAPEFELKDLEGKTWSLKELRGRTVVLNFWFTSCAPCIKEIPELNKLVDEYKNKDVVFLGLTYNTSQHVEAFLKKRAFNYTQLPNAGEISTKYNIFYFPTSFVIDKNAIIKGIMDKSDNIYHDLKTIIDLN
ncbi:peroxiredoxin family protein [Flavobacterium ginsenosidimutans]|uniref:peroxiredoxin family protein n=1 Tax=Flavobacterium ginsenosidimutans TaxID=687844 RepID=UPI000DAF2A1A|nr:TlpA disulfide reductase family protein [Flavobacterium ginsenosidimutans]KAF2327750.1 redoxin domain-containing protein [Flavobacterium ginsenosidimutans]